MTNPCAIFLFQEKKVLDAQYNNCFTAWNKNPPLQIKLFDLKQKSKNFHSWHVIYRIAKTVFHVSKTLVMQHHVGGVKAGAVLRFKIWEYRQLGNRPVSTDDTARSTVVNKTSSASRITVNPSKNITQLNHISFSFIMYCFCFVIREKRRKKYSNRTYPYSEFNLIYSCLGRKEKTQQESVGD